MSKLYGYLSNERDGTSTRAAHVEINADVQTERARISVTLHADGEYRISIRRGDRASGYYDVRATLSGNAHVEYPVREMHATPLVTTFDDGTVVRAVSDGVVVERNDGSESTRVDTRALCAVCDVPVASGDRCSRHSEDS